MPNFRPGKHKDPLPVASFHLEIQDECEGTFRECSGLGSESEVIEHKSAADGGLTVIHKIPGTLKFENIVLKRGVTDDMSIWEWRKKVEDGKIVNARRSGQIKMYNQDNDCVARWDFVNAWPVKISGPNLNAGGNDIAVEEVHIAHEGMKRVDP